MGSFIRLPTRALDGRIDATYYRPEYVANAQRLVSSAVASSALNSLVSDGRRTLYFGTTTLEGDEAPSDWVPFLTSDDLGDEGFFIETRARRRVAPSFLDDYPAGRLRSGELLVKVKGPNQTTAYIETAPEYPVLVSGTIWGGLVRKDIVDPHYLVAALSCPYAAMARTRLRTNLNVEFLGAEDLLSLALPTPTTLAQRYIGDKVRQAERLRERARRLEGSVRQEYRVHLNRLGYVEIPHRKSYRAALRDRLDPAYYDPAFTSVLDAPWLARHSEPLARFFTDGSYGDLPDSGTYGTGAKWLLRATDLDQCMTHWDAGVPVPSGEVNAKSEVKENDILLEVKGAIEKCALGRGPAVGKHVNGTVFRLSPTNINAGYLCLHLTAEIKRKYAAREAVNNIIQYLNLDCIRALPVLRLDPELEGRLGDRFLASIDARIAATSLTSAATTLVEHLLDGHITEADLVVAQKTLDGGDRSADREILRALRQSDAPGARPLIADIDALYALLDETEAPDA